MEADPEKDQAQQPSKDDAAASDAAQNPKKKKKEEKKTDELVGGLHLLSVPDSSTRSPMRRPRLPASPFHVAANLPLCAVSFVGPWDSRAPCVRLHGP